MKFAVIQHELRPTPAADLEALVLAVDGAAAAGADMVIVPDVADVLDGPLGEEFSRRAGEVAGGCSVLVAHRGGAEPAWFGLAESTVRTVVLAGDSCFDPTVLDAAFAYSPGLAVLSPGSESELQSEAVLELAIGLSTSLASLVIVAEPDGAAPGRPGHGGSVIVHLGQVLAEAMDGDGVITAEVQSPPGPPEAREPLPGMPPLLQQRLAAHRGHKVEPDYPADLG